MNDILTYYCFSDLLRNISRCAGIRIYNYHGVVERKTDVRLERNLHLLDDFRAQITFLSRFRVLSIEELAETLGRRTVPRGPAAVLTFDDGYVNNLLAAEILSEAGLPWAVYISTGPLGRGETLW